jgi:hypothetical protein
MVLSYSCSDKIDFNSSLKLKNSRSKMMKTAKTLLALSVIFALSACGGGGGSSSAVDTTPVTPPATSTPPPVSSSGNEVILSGSAEIASESGSTATLGLVGSDMDTIIVAQDRNLLLKVNLAADSSGNISAEGELYSGTQTAAEAVQVTGSATGDNYSLTVSGDNVADMTIALSTDNTLSDSQPAHSGYYELEAEEVYSTALVLSDGELTGNDTDQCQYSGSYQSLTDNLLQVSVEINNIDPFICPSAGEYTGLATSLADTGDDQAFLLALHNDRRAIVNALPKLSDELSFTGLKPGLYVQQENDDEYVVNFGVSHDGTLRGFVVNKLFGGHFNAQPG